MKTLKFKGLLQNEGWITPAYVTIDEAGIIVSITETNQENTLNHEVINGYAIPGFQNAHSHAFQYAMAGLTEDHPTSQRQHDFWSWRDTMYKIALSINPDQLQQIASMLYAEMLRHGYTSVAEFHYLHHDQKGHPYEDKAELAHRLVSAAESVGINITLIPIFYQQGGFNQVALPEQKRFISPDRERYLSLWESSKIICDQYDHAKIAAGFHSLRAVNPSDIKPTLDVLGHSLPIHIHVAEQLQEVAQCESSLQLRPVEWLIEHVGLTKDFHLVHATHINEKEIDGISQSGASVVLCPSTEGNLGDGFFPFRKFQASGGKWSIGTDSHIGLNPLEELRILDYGQRLLTHNRHTFKTNSNNHSGQAAIHQVTLQGREAMGNRSSIYFAEGEAFDALVLDANHPLIEHTGTDSLLSTIVYTGDVSINLGTMIKGNWVIKHQKHHKRQELSEKFGKAIKEIALRV